MRLPTIRYDELDTEQRRLHDAVTKTRSSGLGGPMSVLVRTPHLGAPADALHNAFRLKGKLDRRLFELLVLIVAREHDSEFAWSVHERLALNAGVANDVVNAIRERRAPRFKDGDENLVYDIAVQLLTTSRLNEAVYGRGITAFGVDLTIEIVSAVGFYSMVSLVLNAFSVGPADGSHPLAEADA